ncbi:hypothetical protein SDC9_193218 [bioreactor metagenome]|uniref:Uncharacterized protein n=1 Tax=bioreactor metagenome TaxID=1076179 RepID=A0A645I5D4_9ZZZZ
MHRNQSLIAHDNILKALREGDIQKAAKFTKENWTSFYEALDLSKKLIKNT